MKTDALIGALASDALVERGTVARTAAVLVPASVLVLGLAFFPMLGLRANIGAGQVISAVAMKLAVTLPMAGTGLFLALRLARSNQAGPRIAHVLAVAPMILAVLAGGDLARFGLADWMHRMVGTNGWRCLILVPLLSALPLAAFLVVLRQGAVTRRTLAGAVAGIAAAGIGASVYALNCTDDSPLFIALWYGLSTLIVSAVGAFVSWRFVRW